MKTKPPKKRRLWATIFLSYWWYAICASSVVIFIAYYLHTEPQPKKLDSAEPYSCDLIRVIDGDSVEARCSQEIINIRLQHIDAPELGQPIWGDKAKYYLLQQLPTIFQIRIHGKDVYRRYLATIYVNQDDINLMMITSGFARVYPRYQPPEAYIQAMQKAKVARRGIWAVSGLQQDPQRWRRLSQ